MTTFPLPVFKKLLVLCACCITALNARAADSLQASNSRIELLMNMSNALSRFTGNASSQSAFDEPFLVGMKITNSKKTRAFRIGVNFSVAKVTEDLNNGNNRVSQINSWAPLLGYEWRRNLGKRFQFYGGVDARYYNETNITDTRLSNPSGGGVLTNVFRDVSDGWGAGPFCGFVFNISNHVSFLTEANFYINYIHKVRSFSSDGTHYAVFENSHSQTVTPTAPSSIFLLVRF